MSFKDYVKEQEDLVILDQEKTKKQKVADLIRTMEDLNDEKFRGFAKEELGMEDAESEALVYKMLRDFLLASDSATDEIDAVGDIGIDDITVGGIDDIDDVAGDIEDVTGVDVDVEEVPTDVVDDEDDAEFADIDVEDI